MMADKFGGAHAANDAAFNSRVRPIVYNTKGPANLTAYTTADGAVMTSAAAQSTRTSIIVAPQISDSASASDGALQAHIASTQTCEAQRTPLISAKEFRVITEVPETQTQIQTHSTSTLRNLSQSVPTLVSQSIPETNASTQLVQSSSGTASRQPIADTAKAISNSCRRPSSSLSDVSDSATWDPRPRNGSFLSTDMDTNSDDEPVSAVRRSGREKRKRTSADFEPLKNGMRHTSTPSVATGNRDQLMSDAGVQDQFCKVATGETTRTELLVGTWSFSEGPPAKDQHAVYSSVDSRNHIMFHVVGQTIDGRDLEQDLPSKGKTTRDRVSFLPRLSSLNDVELKDYVVQKIKDHDQTTASTTKTPAKKSKKSHKADSNDYDSDGLYEALAGEVKRNTPRQRGPLISYAGDAEDTESETVEIRTPKKRLGLKSFKGDEVLAKPTSRLNTPDSKAVKTRVQASKHATPNAPQPSDVLVGYWRDSDGATPADKHAMYAIIKNLKGGQLRFKVVKYTRAGVPCEGNFPSTPGAMFRTIEETVLEPHLEGLARCEIHKYVEIRRSDYINRPDPIGSRHEAELRAVREAKAAVDKECAETGIDIRNVDHKRNEARVKTQQQRARARVESSGADHESDHGGIQDGGEGNKDDVSVMNLSPIVATTKNTPKHVVKAAPAPSSAPVAASKFDPNIGSRANHGSATTKANGRVSSGNGSAMAVRTHTNPKDLAKRMQLDSERREFAARLALSIQADKEKRLSAEIQSPSAAENPTTREISSSNPRASAQPFSSPAVPTHSEQMSVKQQMELARREANERRLRGQVTLNSLVADGDIVESVKHEMVRPATETTSSAAIASARSKIVTLPIGQAQALANSVTNAPPQPKLHRTLPTPAQPQVQPASSAISLPFSGTRYDGHQYEVKKSDPYRGCLVRNSIVESEDISHVCWDVLRPLAPGAVRQFNGKWWNVNGVNGESLTSREQNIVQIKGIDFEKITEFRSLA